MIVALDGGAAAPADIPLSCSLLYEGGATVEDSDQGILRPMCQPYNPFTIKQGQNETEVRFRLEKVSRRKDNRRFCVRVEPDPNRAQGAARSIRGADSTPILVLSKRRTGERSVSRGGKGSAGSPGLMPMVGNSNEAAALAALAASSGTGGAGSGAILAALQRMERTQQHQSAMLQQVLERLASLERHAHGGSVGVGMGMGMGMPSTSISWPGAIGRGTGIPAAFGWQDQGPSVPPGVGSNPLMRIFSSEVGTSGSNMTSSSSANGGLALRASQGFAPIAEGDATTPGVVSAGIMDTGGLETLASSSAKTKSSNGTATGGGDSGSAESSNP